MNANANSSHGNTNPATPETAPVTREVVRTPVSAKLADIIRTLDDTLMAEHGPFAFAYAIMVGDGLAGASNARDGFVPPLTLPPVADGPAVKVNHNGGEG